MHRITVFAVIALSIYCMEVQGDTTPPPEKPCGPNEARLPCGRRCENRCNSPRPANCDTITCRRTGCRCTGDFWRNPATGSCVPKRNCPADGCATGEILGACGKKCEGTCEAPFEPETCKTINCADKGCRCDIAGGFVRQASSKTCVRINKCT